MFANSPVVEHPTGWGFTAMTLIAVSYRLVFTVPVPQLRFEFPDAALCVVSTG